MQRALCNCSNSANSLNCFNSLCLFHCVSFLAAVALFGILNYDLFMIYSVWGGSELSVGCRTVMLAGFWEPHLSWIMGQIPKRVFSPLEFWGLCTAPVAGCLWSPPGNQNLFVTLCIRGGSGMTRKLQPCFAPGRFSSVWCNSSEPLQMLPPNKSNKSKKSKESKKWAAKLQSSAERTVWEEERGGGTSMLHHHQVKGHWKTNW